MIKRSDGATDIYSINRYVLDANILISLIVEGDCHNDVVNKLYELILERDNTNNPVFIISPASIFVEVNMKFNKLKKEGRKLKKKFTIKNSTTHPIDDNFIQYMHNNNLFDKFSSLGSQDVLYAVIAHYYNASLVTLDNDFNSVNKIIKVINLNTDSIDMII